MNIQQKEKADKKHEKALWKIGMHGPLIASFCTGRTPMGMRFKDYLECDEQIYVFESEMGAGEFEKVNSVPEEIKGWRKYERRDICYAKTSR